MVRRVSILRVGSFVVLLLLMTAGAGFGAAAGASVVTITAAAGLDVTVPAAASIASTTPGSCSTSSASVINVKSNKAWNVQIRSEPVTYPNGKAKDGTTELADAFQYKGADISSYTNVTASYSNLYSSNQAKTTGVGVDVSMYYKQCIEYADSPGTYTIVIEYLSLQP